MFKENNNCVNVLPGSRELIMLIRLVPFWLSFCFVRVSKSSDVKESIKLSFISSSFLLLTGVLIETLFALWTHNWTNVNHVLQRCVRNWYNSYAHTYLASDFAVLRGRCCYLDRSILVHIHWNYRYERHVFTYVWNLVIFQERIVISNE